MEEYVMDDIDFENSIGLLENEFDAFDDDEYDQREFLADAFGPTHFDYYE